MVKLYSRPFCSPGRGLRVVSALKEKGELEKAPLECSTCAGNGTDVDWRLEGLCSKLTRYRKAEGIRMIREEACEYSGLS